VATLSLAALGDCVRKTGTNQQSQLVALLKSVQPFSSSK
jgi:hypothetical protein